MASTISIDSVRTDNFQLSQAHLGDGNTVIACTFDARNGGTSFVGMKAFIDDGRFVVEKGEAIGGSKIAAALQDNPGFHNQVAHVLKFGIPLSTGGIKAS